MTTKLHQILVLNAIDQHIHTHKVTVEYLSDMAASNVVYITPEVMSFLVESGKCLDKAREEFAKVIRSEGETSSPPSPMLP